jgi:hypothetical protein
MPAKTRIQLLEENIDLREREDDMVEILEDDALDPEEKLDRLSALFEKASEDEDDGDDQVEREGD